MSRIANPTAISCATVALVTLAASWLIAGPLNPPAGPVAPTYKTLSEVEPRTAISQATTPGDPTNLFIITQPGSYYLTAETVGGAGKNGLRITTSNVTIDLNGFRLVGGAGSLSGIVLPVVGQRNVTVSNGVIGAWGQLGIDLNLVRNCIVRDIQVVDSGASGIHLGECASVTGCLALTNGSHGFVASHGAVFSSCSARQNGGDGFNTATASVVTGCASVFNVARGFFANSSSTVAECSASGNGTDGISLGTGCAIARCNARENGADGIIASAGSFVRDNLCAANGQATAGGSGISISGTDSRVEGNNCTGQTRGININTAGNIIMRNTCSGNFTNWAIVAGNAVAPIAQVTNNASAISGNTYAGSLGSTDPNANFTY